MTSRRFAPTAVMAASLLAGATALFIAGCNNSSTAPAPPGPPASSGAMFITDFTNNSVLVYGQNANCGSCNQARLIQGSSTGIFHPIGIALDSSGTIYVANEGSSGNSITEYPGQGKGNIAPSFTIPSLASPYGVAVDAAKNVYVANSALGGGTPSVQIFPPGSKVASNTISGAATGLHTPGFVTLDASGDIWVGDQSGNSIQEFPPLSSNPNGNIAPIATLGGNNTAISSPQGIAFDSAGRLYVAINNPTFNSFDAVLVFQGLTAGTNNIAPVNAICGAGTGVNNPTGIAINSLGTVFVVNSQVTVSQSGYITTFASNNIGNTSCTGPLPNASVAGPAMLNPTGIGLH